MKIVIVMPTYNEAENISKMIDVLTNEIFPKIKNHQVSLLVIDSHSPDGTWKIVAAKSKKYPSIHLLDEGGKYGLSAAYIHGFAYAIKNMHADGIMEMDADFQHNPRDIPRFLAEFDKGFDYIIGSRYIPGGSVPANWGFKRKFLSFVGGSLFTRITTLMFPIHDFTTGYRLARVKGFLDQMDLAKVFTQKSFTYKIYLIEEMRKRGAKIKEIPIDFAARAAGDSKMTTNNIPDSLMAIVVIWQRRLGISL